MTTTHPGTGYPASRWALAYVVLAAACTATLIGISPWLAHPALAACRTSSGVPAPYGYTVTSSGYKTAETSSNSLCADRDGWYKSSFRKTGSSSFCVAVTFAVIGGSHTSNKRCDVSTTWASGPSFFEADREASLYACAWGKYDEFPSCPDGPYLNIGF